VTGIGVRALAAGDAEACDRIIQGLPYHFGMEEGRVACARAVREQEGLVATDGDEVVGFLTWEPRFDEAAEITWMAVRHDRRRRGIGGLLLDRLAEDLARAGRRSLAVLTLSENDPDPTPEPDDGYQTTRAFYRANGFVPVRDIPREWEENLAVLMVKHL
jgi:ribosomal protein S18 acetylase RimI-like enzyme